MKIIRIALIGIISTLPTFLLAQQSKISFGTFDEDQWVASIIEKLTLEQKIGQLIFPPAWSNRDSAHSNEIIALIDKYQIGGLIFFQGDPVSQAKLTNLYNEKSSIPLLIGIDAEWGLGMRLDSTISYPYQMTLGAITDNTEIYQMGFQIGKQLSRLGVHLNLAPVLDVNNNAENPVIGFRSFGSNKSNVAVKGWNYTKGMLDAGVIPVGKHFPGHGDTNTDSHLDLPVLTYTYERLDSLEFHPFRYSIDRGLPGVMSAHLSIPELTREDQLPSTLSKVVISDILRDSLSFNGVVFTDAMNMQGVTNYFKSGVAEKRALMAGNDVILYPSNIENVVEVVAAAVRSGEIALGSIEEKVEKVLRLKYRSDLLSVNKIRIENLVQDLNLTDYHLLKRKLLGESITVLANKDDLLPLRKLDTLSIRTLHLGKDSISMFEKRSADYTAISSSFLKEDSENEYQENLIILTVSGMSKFASKDYGLTTEKIEAIESVISEYRPVLNWIGSPYGLSKIQNLEECKAILITYEESPLTLDLSAQVIFGGISASGRLPVDVNQQFPEGSGINTSGEIRFQYTLPEDAGVDGKALRQRLDSIAVMALDSGVAPGIQVLVAKDRKVIFHETWGFHTYDSLRPVEKTDLYDLASITKITGALPALMQLHDQGVFDIDGTLGDYLPYFKKGNKKDLSIRRILSHNSGMEAWIPYWTMTVDKKGEYKKSIYSQDSTIKYSIKLKDSLWLRSDYQDKIYKMIKKSPVDKEQGYVYSGLSFYLWPEAVENISGLSYQEYLKINLYDPLGAATIGYNPLDRAYTLEEIIPTEVDTFFRKMSIHGVVHDEGAAMMGGVSSNAGLFASTQDLAKIMQMYLDKGSYGGQQFISENTVEKFIFCHYCNLGNRRGLAFDKPVLEDKSNGSTAVEASDHSFGHSGYTGTFAWADPENNVLFIFMSNRVYPTRNNRKLYQLNVRPAMHQVIYDSILGPGR